MGKREAAALAFHRLVVTETGEAPVAIRVVRPRGVVIYLCSGGEHWHKNRRLALKCSASR